MMNNSAQPIGESRGSLPPADLVERRRITTESLLTLPLAGDVEVEKVVVNGIPAVTFTRKEAADPGTLLYFHGGGYRLGSAEAFRSLTSHLCSVARIRVVSVDYRLAPESPFPGALDDAVAAYQGLLAEGVPAQRIVVGGDSAGGGIAASLLLEISRLGLAKPASAILASPWLDLRNSAASFTTGAATDALFSKAAADEASAMYLAGWPADDPRVSPVLGDWAGQPRVLIQASTSEVLRDDAVALAAAARSAGVDVTLTLYPDVPHVWHLRYPHDPAAVAAFDEISGFVAP